MRGDYPGSGVEHGVAHSAEHGADAGPDTDADADAVQFRRRLKMLAVAAFAGMALLLARLVWLQLLQPLILTR